MDKSGHIVGSQNGFNEFSAMPSVHIAWALVAGFALVALARAPWARAFGVVYPFLMLVAVVVTGNHYFMDVQGGMGIVFAAFVVASAWERCRRSIPGLWHRPAPGPIGGP
jgi:membrane-associated phospholipid phosphatase